MADEEQSERDRFFKLPEDNDGNKNARFNSELAAYSQQNPTWTMDAQSGVNNAISFARRYADVGDYTYVSSAAFAAMVKINFIYIKKGNDVL